MTTCVHRLHGGEGIGVCASCLRDRLLALAAARVEQHSSEPAAPSEGHPLPEPQPLSASPPSSSSSSSSSSAAACRSLRQPLHPSICGRCGSSKFPGFSSLFTRQRSEKAEPEPAGAPKSPTSPKSPESGHGLPCGVQARQKKRNSEKLTRGGKSGPESECNTESTSRSLRHPLPTNGRRAASEHHRHRLWLGLAGASMCIAPLMRAARRRRKFPRRNQESSS